MTGLGGTIGGGLHRLGALMRRPDLMGMATVVSVKVGMVALNFTLITLAARSLSADMFGHYSVLFSAAGLLCIVAALGQEPFVIRMWNEMAASGDVPKLKGALIFTCAVWLIGASIVAAAFFPWARDLADGATAIMAVFYLFVAAALQIAMHLVRTEIGVAKGDGAGNAIVALMPIGYLAFCLFSGAPAELTSVFLALGVGALLALALQLFLIGRRIRQRFPDFGNIKPVIETRSWIARSGRFWLTSSLEAANQYIDVIIVGYLMDPVTAGAYFVTVRLANLFAAAADTINLFGTRHLPGLFFRNEQRALSQMLDSLAWIALAFTSVGLVVIAVGGRYALQMINEIYVPYLPELLILSIGTATLGMARPATIMLLISGHEASYLRISAVSVLMRVIGLFVFVPPFGVMGAVSTTAVCFAAQALAVNQAARRTTAVDASMLRLLRSKANR